jgi:dolichyl-phosphate-mannose-protein mannosyltransferase
MTSRNGATGTGRDWALVGSAWLALVLALSVWLAMDRRPPARIHAAYLERAVLCAQGLGTDRSVPEPPIVPCAAGLIYRAVPSDVAAAQVVIFLFLGLGMAAIYVLGRELGGSTAGVAAAWIFGSAPLVLYTALRFELDLPLAAMVAAALFALSRTDGFTRTGMSAIAGLVCAAGMLVKPSFGVYVLGPVLWLLLRERSRVAALNAVLTIVVAAAISLPWYGPRLLGLPMQASSLAMPSPVHDGGKALALHATWIVPELGVLAVALVMAGLVVAALRRRGFAIVGFLAPLMLFIVLPHSDLRHTLPLLPMAAVLAGMTVGVLGSGVRWPALVVLALVGAAQLGSTAWGMPPVVTLPVLEVPSVLSSPVMRDDWRQRDVLRAIANDGGGRPVTVSIVSEHDFFAPENFRYYALRERLPFRFVGAWEHDPIGMEYIVLKTGVSGPRETAETIQRAATQFAREPALARIYPTLGEFQLPDGSTATLRVRRIPEGVTASPERLAQALETAVRRRLGALAREVDNLAIRIDHDAEIVRGRVKRIEVSADSARLAEYRRSDAPALRVRRLSMVADDVLVNPFTLEVDGRADLLDVGRLRLAHVEVGGDDLQAFLGGLRAFRRTRVRLTSGGVYVTARQRGADVSALVHVKPATTRPFALEVTRASVGWVPVPAVLVNWLVRQYDPTPHLRSRLPFPVDIGRVTVTEHALRIGE